MPDTLVMVAPHAHAKPIDGGGSASGWTRDEIPPVKVQETREANGESILVHVQLKW
jgi:hypothetical protein